MGNNNENGVGIYKTTTAAIITIIGLYAVAGCDGHSSNNNEETWDLSSAQAVNQIMLTPKQWHHDKAGTEAELVINRRIKLILPYHQTLNRYVSSMFIEKYFEMLIVGIRFGAQTKGGAYRLAKDLCRRWNLPTAKLEGKIWNGSDLAWGPVELLNSHQLEPNVEVFLGNSYKVEFFDLHPAMVHVDFIWLSGNTLKRFQRIMGQTTKPTTRQVADHGDTTRR